MDVIRKPHFYNSEIKRVIVQLLACFSGYQTVTGTQASGKAEFLDVPMIWGNMSKQAAFVLAGGSDNSMSYIPCGALNMVGLERDDTQRRTPYYSEKFNYIERATTPDGTVIAGVPGRKRTVERFMPVPHKMQFEVSFWCSNEDQKFQLIEQIGAMYSVQMDFLMGNSPADWTNISWLLFDGKYDLGHVKLEGGQQNDPYHLVTLPFTAGIWLGLPVKVYDTKFIEKIHVPIYQLNIEVDWDSMPELDHLVVRATEKDILKFENYNPAPLEKPKD